MKSLEWNKKGTRGDEGFPHRHVRRSEDIVVLFPNLSVGAKLHMAA